MVALRLTFVVKARMPRSTNRKSNWMALAQYGDGWEARRAMNLSEWLDMEDPRPGALGKEEDQANAAGQAPSQESFIFIFQCHLPKSSKSAGAMPILHTSPSCQLGSTSELLLTHLFVLAASSSFAARPVSAISEHALPPTTCLPLYPPVSRDYCMVDGRPSPLSCSQTGCGSPPKAPMCHSFL